MSADERLFCDIAEDMRRKVDSYDAGWSMVRGMTTVSIDALREWTDAMEHASVLIEGPPG